MKLPPLLDPQTEKEIAQVVQRGTRLWLGGMFFSLLLIGIGLVLMVRSSPHLHFPVFFHFLSLFLSSLFLAVAGSLRRVFFNPKKLAYLSRAICFKRYILFLALAYFLVCNVMLIGGLYVFLSGNGRDSGLFLSLNFFGFILFMPRQEELRSLLLSCAQGKASGAS